MRSILYWRYMDHWIPPNFIKPLRAHDTANKALANIPDTKHSTNRMLTFSPSWIGLFLRHRAVILSAISPPVLAFVLLLTLKPPQQQLHREKAGPYHSAISLRGCVISPESLYSHLFEKSSLVDEWVANNQVNWESWNFQRNFHLN